MESVIPEVVNKGSNRGAVAEFAHNPFFSRALEPAFYGDNEPVNFSKGQETGLGGYSDKCDIAGALCPISESQSAGAIPLGLKFCRYAEGTGGNGAEAHLRVWQRYANYLKVRSARMGSANQFEKSASGRPSGTVDAQNEYAMSQASSEVGEGAQLTQTVLRHDFGTETPKRKIWQAALVVQIKVRSR